MSPTCTLWQHNTFLLQQAVDLVDRLQAQAKPGFNYAQAVGPHLRHIIEHGQALLDALKNTGTPRVDYDARQRALDVQTQSHVTRIRLKQLMTDMALHEGDVSKDLNLPMTTLLQSGAGGETAVEVQTTLGRELLFLASHTVHHFALVGHYCKAAGVDLGPDFGKAPATLAFERQVAHAA